MTQARIQSWRRLAGIAAAACLLLLSAAGCGAARNAETTATQGVGAAQEAVQPTSTPTEVVSAAPTRVASIDGLPVVYVDELPREARETLRLIEQGGPFPYEKDGSVFQNREGLLPDEPRGYYREYTVITPGENDRGARRIVSGDDGELYYTDDHYDSFQRIMEQ
jgi:ribonuclease T1